MLDIAGTALLVGGWLALMLVSFVAPFVGLWWLWQWATKPQLPEPVEQMARQYKAFAGTVILILALALLLF